MIFQFGENCWIDFESVDTFTVVNTNEVFIRFSGCINPVEYMFDSCVEFDALVAAWKNYVKQTNEERKEFKDDLAALGKFRPPIDSNSVTYRCGVCKSEWRVERSPGGMPEFLKCPSCNLEEGKQIGG